MYPFVNTSPGAEGCGFLCGCDCTVLHNSLLRVRFVSLTQNTRLTWVPSSVSPKCERRCADICVCVLLLLNGFQLQSEGFPFSIRIPVPKCSCTEISDPCKMFPQSSQVSPAPLAQGFMQPEIPFFLLLFLNPFGPSLFATGKMRTNPINSNKLFTFVTIFW